MVGDIIALVDLILNRRDKVKENKQNYLNNFIEPVFSQFKIVHNNYLETFNSYRSEIESSQKFNINIIVNKIKKDSLFSQNLRSELLAPLREELASEFISAIYNYLQLPYLIAHNSVISPANIARESLIRVLELIDQLTPEVIIRELEISDIEELFLPLEISNPGYTKTKFIIDSISLNFVGGNVDLEAVISNKSNDLEKVTREQDEIKKILALGCIDVLVNQIQESYSHVVQIYWQQKSKIIEQ
jgi:hypothetical protein